MPTQFLNPPSLCSTFGWTHVVAANGGTTIHLSGQVAVNERGEIGRASCRERVLTDV